jgi:glycosyltransferase involved in cell wall biosynthesis
MIIEKKQIKILFFAKYFFPALGGGEFFLHKVLKSLKNNPKYFVYSACYFNPNETPFKENNYIEWDEIPVFQLKPTDGFIEKFIKKTKPDIVITQSFDAPHIIDVAKSIGAKTIMGTHFWRNICEVDNGFTNMLTRDISAVRLLKQNHRAFFNADQVYVNSEFMRLALKRYTGFDCQNTIHPIIDLDRILIKNKNEEREYITLINPDEGKGGDLFLSLAKKLKDMKFLCVGKGNDFHLPNKIINKELLLLSNVKMVESTGEMSKIYEKTKILLVPSKVDETFSMVDLEAMFNGIPVIASNYGNLPFLVREAGFNLPTESIEVWEEAIKGLIENKDFYNIISRNGIEESKKYLPEIELEKFIGLVEKCTGSDK